MIIPCIDLMDGKVVQLAQGRTKILEGKSPKEMLAFFADFPQIQVIDLDAALGNGSNDRIVRYLAGRATIRVGGGVRTVERARQLIGQGAFRVIVGTSAFSSDGINFPFLAALTEAIGPDHITIALDSKDDRVVVKGWQASTALRATDVISELEPYCSGFLCTYVDKEGLMEGTDLDWFKTLRAGTQHELIAAGGITSLDEVRVLSRIDVHCAIGMALYTGRLSLHDLRAFQTTQ
ncbi:MAG: 1-(5-phosphoribosyl)-5-[(5-phosphoribosylamino)methylideneamino] imidazole-4-carboxamide isomerase [Acidobacteriaceae bacterium]|nr:1-(5-phosphoribosyl)-5-[(5-phosphoribosylamino)methylideneamino] imidazole-4-carboxamide isomerase [Acidobacteriaceae bacterium]MBV9781675.1 1-(5-phosphoribosyl)-5-[(5-phosphoribosylamino)methylideneamino] imidazole-4-carboxamide isomerase [Acidobacteriaceae bacterium]